MIWLWITIKSDYWYTFRSENKETLIWMIHIQFQNLCKLKVFKFHTFLSNRKTEVPCHCRCGTIETVLIDLNFAVPEQRLWRICMIDLFSNGVINNKQTIPQVREPASFWLVVGGDLWNSSSRPCVIGGIGEEIPFPA